ncbi:MAG: hypothetical protein IH597_05470 [Bacteroidales bacterium]|nr:hypothetical protein [Bacteroidales bacterium]
MESIVITPKNKKAIPFLKRLLESLEQVKHVKIIKTGAGEEDEDSALLEEMLKGREEGFLSASEKSDFLRLLKQTAGL